MRIKIILIMIFNFLMITTVTANTPNNCLQHMNDHLINSDTLWLDECGLNDKDMRILISYLNEHPKVTQLYLLNNNIGDEGAVQLASAKTISMLELRNNQISSKGALALSKSNIHMLDLKGNNLTSQHLEILAQNTKDHAGNNEIIILG